MMEDFPVANFLQLLVYGLQLGSIYALLAIGYSMVFGIVRMINMAHCDFLMMGCYIVYFLVTVVFGGAEMISPAVAPYSSNTMAMVFIVFRSSIISSAVFLNS